MKTLRYLGLLIFGVLLTSLLSSCSPVQFSAKNTDPVAPTDPSGIDDPTCTPGSVDEIRRMTKLLFIVDTSGSNVGTTSWMGALIPPTDPQKRFRFGALSDFLARYRHKTNFQWGLITFSGNDADALINWGSRTKPAFAPAIMMENALHSFYFQDDGGMTPYGAALKLARNAIQNDPDRLSNENPQYIVILISDGFPTDYFDYRDRFDQKALEADIDSLLSVAPQQILLSTIFYGQVIIPQAVDLLQSIAYRGGGHFATVQNLNSGFRIDDVIPGQTTPCH